MSLPGRLKRLVAKADRRACGQDAQRRVIRTRGGGYGFELHGSPSLFPKVCGTVLTSGTRADCGNRRGSSKPSMEPPPAESADIIIVPFFVFVKQKLTFCTNGTGK